MPPPPSTHPPAGGGGIVISAPGSGQGKTTVTLGLLRALRDQGVQVASAKCGPDYIDPAFHAAATGLPCVTLDAWAGSDCQVRARAGMQEDLPLLVIEGAMGLFDGAPLSGPIGAGATAEVARALGVPVILVLDAAGIGQTAGAIVDGLARWAPDIHIGGVILNRVGSPRHEEILKSTVERVCPVIGAIPKSADLARPSRHLGLVQAGEMPDLESFLAHAAGIVAANCDLAIVQELAKPLPSETRRKIPPFGQRIAVASDIAFGFAYWHMLEDWREAGAQISFFSPLENESPALDADAIFLPGGYPELHAGRLSAAASFMDGLRNAATRGALIYGECGGYMVLGQGLTDAGGQTHKMAGLLDLETSFAARKLHLGYRKLTGQGPLAGGWMGHEFHYATTIRATGDPLFKVTDAAGTPLAPAGLIAGRVMGSFAHIIEACAR